MQQIALPLSSWYFRDIISRDIEHFPKYIRSLLPSKVMIEVNK